MQRQTATALWEAAPVYMQYMDPPVSDSLLSVAGTKLKAGGQQQQALELYRQAVARHSKYAPGHYNLAVLLSEIGQVCNNFSVSITCCKRLGNLADCAVTANKQSAGPLVTSQDVFHAGEAVRVRSQDLHASAQQT